MSERAGFGRRAVLAGVGAIAFADRAFGMGLGPALATTATPAFIDALIGRMTVKEKAGQLTLMASAIGGRSATTLNPPGTGANARQQLADAHAGTLTGIFNGEGSDWHRKLQQRAVKSRLGIPMLFCADVIHGFRTIFPVPLGEAASFDPDLARRTARAAAIEASAAGIDLTFAPMVDIARDARWGRGVEAAGEDVLVGRRFAAARVQGFQGGGIANEDCIASCIKHFAAYGAGEAGLEYNSVDVSERTLREVYFPPFQAGLGAGAAAIMPSFNEISGIPSTGNHWLLSDVLRGEWDFRGLVISDYTADEELIAAGYAEGGRDATKKAFLAGVDVSMESGLYLKYLPDLVASGEVPMARLDEAVRRVLVLKAALGLFDDPFRRLGPGREQARVLTPASRALSREAARASVVMLKNEGGLLPLRPDGTEKIALIGPFASGQHDLIGPWNVYGDDAQAIDLATGMRAAMRDPSRLLIAKGSDVEKPLPRGIADALAVAQGADIVILAIGESQRMSGESQSRTEIVVPAPQQALAEALATLGKPTIILLKTGRALALEGAMLDAQAILVTWFLGTETGHALADILFGAEAPSGRLPVSFPRESGQVPYHYDHKPTGRPAPPGPRQDYKAQYRTSPNAARFPFGHGLGYAVVSYAGLDTGNGRLSADAPLTVSARIHNESKETASEVVQLYVHARSASITQPVRKLIDFQRIALAPGTSTTVRFTIMREQLLFVGLDLKPTAEPGLFDLWIAPSAETGLKGSFELIV